MPADKSFVPYPEPEDHDFYKNVYSKQEFHKTKIQKDFLDPMKNPIEKVCDPAQFNLQSYQEFGRNFMSSSTPYRSLLLYLGVGAGKTCEAIQITEGLKENVKKMGKKIYIIAKKQVRPNFWRELYNPDKEKKESIPGSRQCTGTAYYIPKTEVKDEQMRERKIKNKIRQYYEFFGVMSFVNYVDIVVRKEYPDLGAFFSDCVFVIDEAHGLTGEAKSKTESKKKHDEEGNVVKQKKKISELGILTILKEILTNATGTRLLLLTATPMKDNESELVDLIDLMLLNDKSPLYPVDKKKLFPTETEINEVYLAQLIKGYISYVRGENPITFPKIVEASPAQLDTEEPKIYKPQPPYAESGEELEPVEWIKYTNLIRCPMSNYQYSNYMNTVGKTMSKSGKKSESIDLVGRQSSNIMFPTTPNPTLGQYGNDAFMAAFEEYKDPTPAIAYGKTKAGKVLYKKKSNQYKYKEFNEGFLDLSQIGRYSRKFEIYLKNVIKSRGIVYTYSDFVECGAKIIALMLEANGYMRYKHQKGKETPNLLYLEESKRKFRCAKCGNLKSDPTHQGSNPKYHLFVQATYVLFSGDESKYSKEEVDIVNSDENSDGELIKIIVGTRVSGEGIDYKRIQQVHIIEPWHNNTRLYQVIGRAARHCSHRDLPKDQRKVTVFKYCSAPPQIYYKYRDKFNNLVSDGLINKQLPNSETDGMPFTYHDLFTETADEKVYRRIERKDLFVKKIERIMKINSVDCALNKNANIFVTDLPNTRECDYMECNYTCAGGVEGIDDSKLKVNRDTYNLHFSEPQIDKAQKIIYDILKFNFVLDLRNIVRLVKKRQSDIEKEYIEEALTRILGHPPQKPAVQLIDRFGRSGHLIFTSPYYVFQPDDVDDNRAPLYYRTTPLTLKKRFLNLDALKSEAIAKLPQLQKTTNEEGVEQPKVGTETLIADLVALKNKYKIEAKLDRISSDLKQDIYEAVAFAPKYQNIKPGDFDLKEILISYFDKMDKLYFTIITNEKWYIGHKINMETRLYKEKTGWVTVDDNDEDIKKMQSDMKSIKSQAPAKMVSNFHGYVIYEAKDQTYKFKLIDQEKQSLKFTKAVITKKGIKQGGVSKKTTLSGRVCTDFNKPELTQYAKKLGIIGNLDAETKMGLCDLIELKLREKDDTDTKERWFYNKL
jgi:hypothetical protein